MRQICSLVTATLLFCFLLTSCAPHFYGIKTKEVYKAKNLIITDYTRKSVTYFYDPQNMDSRIFAKGTFHSHGLDIAVTNYSNEPVSINYLQDKFMLITQDDETYYFNKGYLSKYPQGKYISPGRTAHFYLKFPFMIRTMKKKDIKKIICKLGEFSYKTIIVLKPVRRIKDLTIENLTVNQSTG